MNEVIIKALERASVIVGIVLPSIKLTHPEDVTFGDFSSNVAMMYAKTLNMSPKSLAEKIVAELNTDLPSIVESVSVAGPGFINFKVKDELFAKQIVSISKELESFGRISKDSGKQVMVEYTDPNPFKVFHIGHLMANTIGETLSRIVEFSGAKVIRACYQGDVGMHVAKTVWAIMNDGKYVDSIEYLGAMYALGSAKYDEDESIKAEIAVINKKIFTRSDTDINKVYDAGRKFSLEYFDKIYAKLGTKFDHFFFERELADDGVAIVNEFLKKDIFEKSDGAIVFPGEKYGVHTRVFINSQGLPTYEAKELGLTKKKFELYPDLSESIVVTANEQDAYFQVLIKCVTTILPEIGSRMKHLSHGILRPSTGKMSSRKGNVVSADELINEFESLVLEKTKDRDFTDTERGVINNQVAIAGLKYTILRQAIGGDIIYDPKKAVSFEGDSGPYLQYATVRAQAILSKAGDIQSVDILPSNVSLLEKLLVRFPEVIERARSEYAPHHIITYLTELSSAFNSYYANNQIIDEKDELSPYRICLTSVFVQTMKNGLWVLGIQVPKRM